MAGILAGSLILSLAGCGGEKEKAARMPDLGTDTVFCEFRSEGGVRVFRFGHGYPHLSEPTTHSYRFEIDTALTAFAIDSSGFSGILFEQAYSGFGPEPKREPFIRRLEGERVSDSSWALREWVSRDYREWRRRESYRKAKPDPGPPAGFARTCVLRPSA